MSVTFDVDDPRYRITPSQQMLSSCGGALVTSVLGRFGLLYLPPFLYFISGERERELIVPFFVCL